MKNWKTDVVGQDIYLTPIMPMKKGWYNMKIKCQVVSALPMLHDIRLHLLVYCNNGDERSIPCVLTKDHIETFFYIENSLEKICFNTTSPYYLFDYFNVTVRNCFTVSALYQMMTFVSLRDRNNGNDPKRIYNKSFARFKRHGYSGYLSRLLKEYHRADTYALSQDDVYQVWIRHNETDDQNTYTERLAQLTRQPTISIVMATWKSQLYWLKEAINSVTNQAYQNWELCIADDASDDAMLISFLEALPAQDSRIKVVFRQERGHISQAQNSALALATGDYIAFLDHDDVLAREALLSIVETLIAKPETKLLYSDEDKINLFGRRVSPHFKSSWNPELLLAQNYINHLLVIERQALLNVGGFRVGMEGSQDHDLLLRVTANLSSSEIQHISKVLYHWRIVDGSTALNANTKSYTAQAAVKALEDYFLVSGREANIHYGKLPNTYRVEYAIPENAPLVSLLIPTRDKIELLEACVRSILEKTTYPNYEIIIIDNNSVETATLKFFKKIMTDDDRVTVIHYHQPFNYSAINNYAVKLAKGEIIALINNDVEVITPNWLTEMVGHVCRPEVGCVGAKLYFSDGSIQHAGVILGLGGVAGHSHKYFDRDSFGYFGRLTIAQNLSAVTGACLIVRKEVYEQVGGLDEENLKVAFNDVDFCLKVREEGYLNVWTPYAELYHHESKSRGAEDTPEKQARFQKEVLWMKEKWASVLEADPYYNTHLTLKHEDFSLSINR